MAFQYTSEFHENILGFCNNIYNSEGGAHITGFKTAFTGIINSYARELGILKDKDANFNGADVRNGMTAVVSVKHPDPRFEGQTKTKLDNIVRAIVISVVLFVLAVGLTVFVIIRIRRRKMKKTLEMEELAAMYKDEDDEMR